MNTTEPLAEALTAEGWTSSGGHGAARPGGCSRELTSRDGLLTAQISAAPEGISILLTAKTVRRPEMCRRGWQAQLEGVPLPVALAVIAAAGEEPAASWPAGAASLLTAAGWRERDEPDEDFEDEDGAFEFYDSVDETLQHCAWASPDGTSSVEWFGPDEDPAFWSIARDTAGRRTRTRATHHAPAAVIAALALADPTAPTPNETDTVTEACEARLDAWAATLTEAGWKPVTVGEIPSHIVALRHLIDPAGRVEARARADRDREIGVSLRSTARRPDGGLAWHVIAGWVPADIVIAAAREVGQETGEAAGALLTGAGWHLQSYERITAGVGEHQWENAEGTRWAQFTDEDPDPEDGEPGGWVISTPGSDGHNQRILAAARTPAATIAALALST